jgi:hypothetical protein
MFRFSLRQLLYGCAGIAGYCALCRYTCSSYCAMTYSGYVYGIPYSCLYVMRARTNDGSWVDEFDQVDGERLCWNLFVFTSCLLGFLIVRRISRRIHEQSGLLSPPAATSQIDLGKV